MTDGWESEELLSLHLILLVIRNAEDVSICPETGKSTFSTCKISKKQWREAISASGSKWIDLTYAAWSLSDNIRVISILLDHIYSSDMGISDVCEDSIMDALRRLAEWK